MPLRWLTLLLLFVPSLLPAAESWYLVDLDDFRIVSNGTSDETRKIAESIHVYRYALGQTQPTLVKPAPIRPTIFVLTPNYFDRFGTRSRTFMGFVRRGEFSADAFIDRSKSVSRQFVAQHELTHFYLHLASDSALPYWYDEGTAELFATTQMLNGKVLVGLPNRLRWESLQIQVWRPMREVFAAVRPSNGDVWDGYSDAIVAQSWLLMHYATIAQPELLGRLSHLLALEDAGLSVGEALEQVFPGSTFDQLERNLKSYSDRRSKPYLTLKSRPPEAAVELQTLSDEQAKYELALMLARRGGQESLETAAALLGKPLPADSPELPPRRVALEAWLAVKTDGSRSPAVPWLARCVTLAEQSAADDKALVLCGDAQLVSDHPLEARRLYERALAVNSANFEAVHSLALTYPNDSAPAGLLAQLEDALAILPSSMLLREDAYRIYAAQGNLGKARFHIEKAVLKSRDSEQRQSLLRLLRQLESASEGQPAAITTQRPSGS
ncbi:MAG: hypothetical protein R3E77_00135 [Steroidobacteraceae bacterium]